MFNNLIKNLILKYKDKLIAMILEMVLDAIKDFADDIKAEKLGVARPAEQK